MGRATEYFDYIGCDPKRLRDHMDLYCSFTPKEEDKKARRKNLARIKKLAKSGKIR